MPYPAIDALTASGIDLACVAELMPRVDPARVTVRRSARAFHAMWLPGIIAIAMPWGIYLEPATFAKPKRELGPLIVHELMHIEQYRRHGAVGHVARYLYDYVASRRRGSDHYEAYLEIRQEQEARAAAAYVASLRAT